jgi:alpha-amylase
MGEGTVTLLMAVHCHQPVGNFDAVFEEAFAKSYEPFLAVLERHPRVRLALHYSGCLLDWLATKRPAFLARVRALAARRQIELLASGYYEPILPLLPEPDRQGQLARMREALRRHFGVEASGCWLTERVWEPDLPGTLARAGIRYTMVDASQFHVARAGLPPAMQVQDEAFWDVLGSYTTEHGGATLRLFPASKRLRYWMPFQPVERTIEFLRRLRRDAPVALTFADDGEKFGLWPKTYAWVYESGWLDQFFGALEREQGWLATTTFRDYVDRMPPQGAVYLPCGSYEEMLEWSGGSFRNFFTKYPEANALQQHMLQVSRQLEQVPSAECRVPSRRPKKPAATRQGQLVERARQELYAGQCNCAYWHGVFGGLYLSHLRRGVTRHLIAAEDLLRQAAPRAGGVSVEDVDGDDRPEVALTTDAMRVIVDPADGGSLAAWRLFGPRVNLLDTLARRYEPYHEKLKARQPQAAATAGQGVASIHDALGVKEAGLDEHLIYDDHRRTAFLDYGLQEMPSLRDVVRAAWGERRLWSQGPYALERTGGGGARQAREAVLRRDVGEWRLRKVIRVQPGRPVVECRYEGRGGRLGAVALEFNISLRDPRYLAPAERAGAATFDLAEDALGVSLGVTIDPPTRLLTFPVETVSESEQGLERTYQGLCVLCLWDVRGADQWSVRLAWRAETP